MNLDQLTGNGALLAAENLRVMHIRGRTRNLTVAYRQLHGSPLVEIATAIHNPKDIFSKKLGTYQAIQNFKAGKTIIFVNDNDDYDDLTLVDRFQLAFGE